VELFPTIGTFPGMYSERRLRVLTIDEEAPWPLTSGKRIRTWNLLRRLATRHELSFLCYAPVSADAVSAFESAGIRLRFVPQLAPDRGICLYGRLLVNCLSSLPYSVSKHYTRRFQEYLQSWLSHDQFDLLHCEWTPYMSYAESVRQPVVVSAHNIECQILSRHAEHAPSLLARRFFRMQAQKMERFERKSFSAADMVLAVSQADCSQAQNFGARRVRVVDNGVDLDYFLPMHVSERCEVVFIGSLDWRPNRDAVTAFFRDVLPLLRQKHDDVMVTIVGRRPPADFTDHIRETPGVELIADASDVRPYLARAAVVAVPLRVGGGTRIKILEALAMKKAVVSTSVGAEGLATTDQHDICIADSPLSFAEQTSRLLCNPEERQRLGANGRSLVEKRYSWDGIADVMEQAWLEAVGVPVGMAVSR